MPKDFEQFERFIKTQEAKGKSPIDTIARRIETEEFCKNYSVSETTPLICPACSAGFSMGHLWWNPAHPSKFVCKTCRLAFTIECSVPLPDLIETKKEQRQKDRESRKKAKS